jgi:hypothetical protein
VKKKKGILLVHGMGEQKKDATLRVMVTPIIKYLWHAKNEVPQVTTDYLPAGEGASSITVEYGDYDLKFVEAWWKPSVSAPAFDPMLGWIGLRALIQLKGLLKLAVGALLPPVGVLLTAAFLAAFALFALLIYGAAQIRSLFANGLSQMSLNIQCLAAASTSHIRCAAKMFQWFKKQKGEGLIEGLQRAKSPGKAMEAVLKFVRRRMVPGDGDAELVDHVLDAQGFWQWAGRMPLLLLGMLYQLLNSIIAIAVYALGVVLALPMLGVLFLLARIASVPGAPSAIVAVKAMLDKFLVGSLGDIRVYLEDPLQAATIRAVLENAAGKLHCEGYKELYILAHSTGAAIAYEALTLKSNQSWSKDVRRLITVGSIMRMVWQGNPRKRRSTFHRALTTDWINFWTRYDPALPGPIEKPYNKNTCGSTRAEVTDVAVTNEDDPLVDHTNYWQNYQQVIRRILAEITDEPAGDGTDVYERQPILPSSHEDKVAHNDKEWQASFQRKRIALLLTVPRLVLTWLPWAFLPFFIYPLAEPRTWLADRLEYIVALVRDDEPYEDVFNYMGAGAYLLESVIASVFIFVIGYLLYSAWKQLVWQMRIGGMNRIPPDRDESSAQSAPAP